jgi:hypothetical protein
VKRFIQAVRGFPGIQRIDLIGSITTDKSNPKDIDVLVTVADDADLAPLATAARRLQGHAQSVNCGADVFLGNPSGLYIGRTCHWKDCRPGVRRSCDALHCGRRLHLHDDLDAVHLEDALVQAPPVTLWPSVVRRSELPVDLERFISNYKHAV